MNHFSHMKNEPLIRTLWKVKHHIISHAFCPESDKRTQNVPVSDIVKIHLKT